jgi:hypothetical protein
VLAAFWFCFLHIDFSAAVRYLYNFFFDSILWLVPDSFNHLIAYIHYLERKQSRKSANMYTKIIALSSLLALSTALPQRNKNGGGRGGGRAQQATAQQQAAQVPQGLSQATDGSIIMDDTVMVK